MVVLVSVNDKNFYYRSEIILYSLLNSCRKILMPWLFYEFMLVTLLKNSWYACRFYLITAIVGYIVLLDLCAWGCVPGRGLAGAHLSEIAHGKDSSPWKHHKACPLSCLSCPEEHWTARCLLPCPWSAPTQCFVLLNISSWSPGLWQALPSALGVSF